MVSAWQVAAGGPPPQPPPTSPPTSGGKRKWIIGGIVGVLAIGAIANAGRNPAPSPDSTPVPTMAAVESTHAPEATPEAGDPAATDELVDEETAAPAFKPIVLKGKGSKVAKFKIPEDAAAIAEISEKGSSNFIVESIDRSGNTNDLLVNEIGSYKGTVLFDADAGEHSVAFKIDSNGTWRIAIRPVGLAKGWNPAKSATGKGDMVLRLTAPPDDLAVVTIKHKGRSNFIVEALGTEGSDLLVNDIGRYSGQSILQSSTVLVTVVADGSWSLKLE